MTTLNHRFLEHFATQSGEIAMSNRKPGAARSLSVGITGGLIGIVALALFSARAAKASTTEVIYSFAGDEDGEYADTDLAIDKAGNIYGTTVSGGDFGGGTVWQLHHLSSGWTHRVLYDFTGSADGGEPYKGVTLDSAGNLYGTAVIGGGGSCEGGCGVVYKVSRSGSKWSQSVIYSFSGGDDGSGPGARVTVDGAGNVYGTTPTGGTYGLGTIYELQPNGSGGYTFNLLHPFTGGADGAGGSAGKLILHDGKLYGVATAGGAKGDGTAYELTPAGGGQWTFRTIYSFKGEPDAGFPYSALTFDAAGNAYGTNYYDGAYDLGSVYELMPTPTGEWNESVIYNFRDGRKGNSPIGNVIFDSAGNLYGTTSAGGVGLGTIFELTSDGNGSWTESTPHIFRGPPDASLPYNGMTRGRDGNFYGATTHGGTFDEGAVYEFTP